NSMLNTNLSINDYIDIIQKAEGKYENSEHRNGFGQPKSKPTENEIARVLSLRSKLSEKQNAKEIRDGLYKYFSDPEHKENLKNSFSFESYLLAELRATDTNYA